MSAILDKWKVRAAQAQRNRAAACARFFLRVGQVGYAQRIRDELTLPLFPLPLIMDCEGVLSRECRTLVERGIGKRDGVRG